jgi:hypothetical protein
LAGRMDEIMGYGITRKPRNSVQAIRFFCLECMGGYDEYTDARGKAVERYMPMNDVRDCPDMKCQLREYRFGKSPRRSKTTPNLTAESTTATLIPGIAASGAAQQARTRRKAANG